MIWRIDKLVDAASPDSPALYVSPFSASRGSQRIRRPEMLEQSPLRRSERFPIVAGAEFFEKWDGFFRPGGGGWKIR